jgi:hypothetical protein
VIFREAAPVIPLLAYALVVLLGVRANSILVPFLLCEAAGIVVYLVEVRYRFRHRNGRR